MNLTEADSHYNNLEAMPLIDVLTALNTEDKTVPTAVEAALPQILPLAQAIINAFKNGGRLFYIGAGTSGRLGIVDASECPPTFGVPHGMVIGIIAGGDSAIRKAVEYAEDSTTQGWDDLKTYNISAKDVVVGIAASGTTPYVIEALKQCNAHTIITGCVTCNTGTLLAATAIYPIEVVTGPEFLTGSTRLKAGTAQKLVLNMLTTSSMIGIGKVKGNKMVDMQLSNIKLEGRAAHMVMEELDIDFSSAENLLRQYGSVRAVLNALTPNHNK